MVCLGLSLRGSILVSALSSWVACASSRVFLGVASVRFDASVGRRCIGLRVCGSMLWLALVFCLFGFSFLHLHVSCIGILDSWFVCGGGCRDRRKTIRLSMPMLGEPEILCLFLREEKWITKISGKVLCFSRT
jgi:hypothetical protein